jgi:hypothetical protein
MPATTVLGGRESSFGEKTMPRLLEVIIKRGVLFLMICTTCRPCFAQVVLDRLGISAPLSDLTAENAAEKIAPYIQAAEAAQSNEDKGKIYAYLASNLISCILDPSLQDTVIEITDKALACNISRPLRIKMYQYKAGAIRRKNCNARGEGLRAPRREMGKFLLMGLRDVMAQLADFDKQHPGFDPEKLPPRPKPRSVYELTAPPEEMKAYNQKMQVFVEYRENQMIQQLDTKTLKGILLDIYARRPYDSDELRALALEITGDTKLAESLVSEVKKWIQAREKNMMGDDVKRIGKDILDAGVAFPKNDIKASPPVVASPAPAPQAPIAPSSPPPRSPWAVVAVVVAICLAGGLVARVVFRRMKSR